MNIDKENLKALAESATKGARELLDSKTINPMGVSAIPVAIPSQMVVLCHVLGSFSPLHDSYVGIASYRKDADFIAAVTPDVILALIAENEALRKDAERYQWLRQGMGKVIVVEPDNAVSCDCDRYEVLLESEVDDAVDADIAKEAGHD